MVIATLRFLTSLGLKVAAQCLLRGFVASLDTAAKLAMSSAAHVVATFVFCRSFFWPHSSLRFVLLKMLADMLRWKAPLALILLHLCLVNNYACDHDEASIPSALFF